MLIITVVSQCWNSLSDHPTLNCVTFLNYFLHKIHRYSQKLLCGTNTWFQTGKQLQYNLITWFSFFTHLLIVLLVEREKVGISISSSPRCIEMLSSSCNAAFRASIAAIYSEVCNDPLVGFRYLKQYPKRWIKVLEFCNSQLLPPFWFANIWLHTWILTPVDVST